MTKRQADDGQRIVTDCGPREPNPQYGLEAGQLEPDGTGRP